MKKRFSIVIALFVFILFGTVLTGCDPEYSSLSLSLNVEQIEMSITDKKADYYITINNYFEFNAEFDFSFAKSVARVELESVEHKGNGVYKFSIIPIIAESTTLTITLKGLDKPLTVPVIITREVTSITAHEGLFVVRGSSLKLNNSMFDFLPGDTNLKGLTFEFPLDYVEEYQANGVTLSDDFVLSAPEDCPYDSIMVTAISTYDVNVSTTFEVLAINNINTTNFKLKIASQNESDPNTFDDYMENALQTIMIDDELVLSLDGETPYVLDLVISDNAGFQKKLAVDYDLWSKGYETTVSAGQNLLLGGNTGDIIAKKQNFDFVLSATDIGESKISFKVYQANLTRNHVFVNLYIKASSKPRQIAINGQVNTSLVELYTNSTEVKEFSFSVVPIKADKNKYNYMMSFYKGSDIQAGFIDDEHKLSSTPTEYISVYYGGAKLQVDSATKQVELDAGQLEKLSSSLTLQAKQTTANDYIAIKLDCLEGESVIASTVMYIKVYVGTTKFEINEIYEDGTIYLSLANGKQTFTGLTVDAGATAGKLTITSVNVGDAICDIEQPSTANCNLEITPKRVGEQEFVITTANNLSVVLKVIVIRQVYENDFSISLKESESEAVANSVINNETNSLSSVTIKGIGSTIKLVGNIRGAADVDANSFSYELYFTEGAGDEYFEITDNSIITSLKFTKLYQAATDSYVEQPVPLFVDLIMYEVIDFIRVEQEVEEVRFTIMLECVNYIKELSLYASEDASGQTKEKTVSIYNKGDLSYVNQNLSTIYLYMDLKQSTNEEFKDFGYANFTFSSNSQFNIDHTTGQVKRGSEVIGVLTLNTTASTNGYLGNFTYDYTGTLSIASIKIVFSVTDAYTSIKFSSSVSLTVEKYIDVDSLWLSTPTKVIYLDETASNQKSSISVQVLPSNAMCQELDVLVETNFAGCIKVDNDPDTNILTFTYQSAGSGTIYIFPKSKMKTQGYYDEFGNMYYHLALEFVCADGKTEQTALKISSYDDLRKISPDKHYYVDTSIDCKGNILDIPVFNKTLRGTFEPEYNSDGSVNPKFAKSEQIGSINNFKVSTNGYANIGLFRTLSPTAKIYNLAFSGEFDNVVVYDEETKTYNQVGIELSETSYIGLVCGSNYGTIKNVTANLSNACTTKISNISSNNIEVYVGLLAGANMATDTNGIFVTKDSKTYTLLANNTANTKLKLEFVKGTATTMLTSYFGGVVGLNNGKISQNNEQSFVTIGLFGITSSVYASTNADFMAGVVGANSGEISGLKAIGTIQGETGYVAGFVGKLLSGNITNNISRVFVSGKNIVSGFVGQVAGTCTLSDNIVQATDDGTKISVDASLIVGIGETSSVYAISQTPLTGVECETYFERNYPIDVTTKYSTTEINFDLSDNIVLDWQLSKDYYYGDILKLGGDADSTLVYANKFAQAEADAFNTNYIKSFVLPAYKQAVLAEQQANVNNVVDLLSLLKFARVGSDGETFIVNDIQVQLSNANLASVEAFGKYIDLNGVGSLDIKVISTLNYRKSATFNVYITNYYESVKIYNSKNKVEEVGAIQLLNAQTTNIYFDCYSTSYNYLNTPISLVANTEVTFDYNYEVDATSDAVVTEIHNQTGYLKTTGGATTFEGKVVNFVSKFIYGTTTYYRYNNIDTYVNDLGEEAYKNLVMYSDGLYTCAFISADDLSVFNVTDIQDTKLETTSKLINAQKGVENISLNKHLISAEPTDSINVVLTYTSYDNTILGEEYINNDTVVPTLKIYTSYIKNEYTTYALSEDGTFKGTSGLILDKTLFTLLGTSPVVQELIYANGSTTEIIAIKYTQNYTLKMAIDTDFDIDVYNYLKDKQIELVFTPQTNTSNNQMGVLVQYTPESITSVLINNYNKNNNTGMVETKDGITNVFADKIIYSGAQTSINEINVLNAYVYTRLSEFDYVDITMTLGQEGGYLAFLEYQNIEDEKVGLVSTNSLYTSITGGATLRIYKEYINVDDYSNTLLISLIYKIPRTVADGTYVPIEFKFYENDSLIYPTNQINLLAKMENQVSFEIYDKQPLNVNDDVLVYQVARGMKYLLDTTIIGYTEDQVVFESSSPNIAYVTKEGNDYYLNITQNAINYDGQECFVVTINSYGQKLEQNKLQTSMIESTQVWIYEYLVNAKQLFGEDTQIGIRMKQTVDIREMIADKINFEYSKTLANTLNEFKQSYIQNANFALVDVDGTEYDLTYQEGKCNAQGVWFEREYTGLYKIKCYKDLLTNELHYNFTALNIGQPCDYSFKVYHQIAYENGKPTVAEIDWDETLSNVFEQTFEVNAYVASSEQNATPIYSYLDMLAMNDGEYYRMVNDITIKASEFQMITAQPAMFDGNGYVIKITSGAIAVNLDNSSSFALFRTVAEESIFKNITVQIDGNLTMTLNNSLNVNGANIAILVSENNGILTNCFVKSSSVVSADIISTVSVMEKSYFAGLCAINTGYITNCQVECNLTANGASLGGFVAENSGYIASSYIKNSRLYNTSSTTNENIVSGGFVCKNLGTINMCYIEGSANSARIYSDYITNDYTLNSKIIYTATKVAGFVYENSGDITDSYSNIPIVSTNMCSGFVGVENGGTLSRVFSLCKLKANDTLNYGFVISYDENKSVFKDCFFVIEQNIINYNTSETNYTATASISTIKYSQKIKGIIPLGIEDFNIVNTDGTFKQNSPFVNFIIDETKEHGVWFYAYDAEKEKTPALALALKSTYSCEVPGITNAQGKAQTFTARRLQLVSPNILAYSKYDLELANDDEFAEHTYLLSSDADAVGSKTNPYIISSAAEFENFCNQLNENNYEYYRLVKNINFAEEEIYTTSLFNKTFVGYFEGNGFEVKAYAVNSITSNLTAGLFGQIGKQNASFSCIKNVSFAPTYINLPNSIYVGGLAGSLVNASVYNVSITGEDVVIVGRNIVGGLFGRTYGETTLNHVYADITAKASKYNAIALKSSEDITNIIRVISYNESGSNKTDVSYAGGIIGYAGGVSLVANANIGANVRTQAMTAGLMFGGVGSITTVKDFDLQLNSHINQVVAYAFGGLIAGENRGDILDFTLNSNILGVNTFVCEPVTPLAVGGIAGLSVDGTVQNMTSKQGYSVIGAEILNTNNDILNPYNQFVVKYVGGIYGYAKGANIQNVNVGDYNLDNTLVDDNKNNGLVVMGGNYVGSIVGYLHETLVDETGTKNADNTKNQYLFNTIIKNNKINLVSSKTYIDDNEQEVTHSTYFSYVNKAVGDSYQTIDDTQRVGLVYGGAITNIEGNVAKLLSGDTDETSNIIYRSQNIDMFYGSYDLCNISADMIGETTTGDGAEDTLVKNFLLGANKKYYNNYYNHFGTNDSGHANIYVKIVDLKTGHFAYDLWSDWLNYDSIHTSA